MSIKTTNRYIIHNSLTSLLSKTDFDVDSLIYVYNSMLYAFDPSSDFVLSKPFVDIPDNPGINSETYLDEENSSIFDEMIPLENILVRELRSINNVGSR